MRLVEALFEANRGPSSLRVIMAFFSSCQQPRSHRNGFTYMKFGKLVSLLVGFSKLSLGMGEFFIFSGWGVNGLTEQLICPNCSDRIFFYDVLLWWLQTSRLCSRNSILDVTALFVCGRDGEFLRMDRCL